jgi:hypothetical protein
VTVGEALAAFEAGWVAEQAFTPRTAYARTLRLLRFHLTREGLPDDAPLDRLTAAHLARFVAWHRETGMADDADGSRKVALHVARLGAHLAAAHTRRDLDLGRERLRSGI